MRRLRLVFISEFDYPDDLSQESIRDLVSQFMEEPSDFIWPVDPDEETFIEISDITEENNG